MLNEKKFERAFNKYKKEWLEDIEYKLSEEEYEENRSEIIEIVEENAVDRDHILLIDLSTISSYYLSKWKNDVLVNGGTSIEDLKKVQMVVLYQCMAHELYKTRYPDMQLEYDFLNVIMALTHYTMFGWEKEEAILFEFIQSYIGENILDADYHKRHAWFLLELYLRFRDKSIFGVNQKVHLAVKEKLKDLGLDYRAIPDELEIYEDVLESWDTANIEEIEKLIGKMSLYHAESVSDIDNSIEFGDYVNGFYPYEILFLMYVRNKLGLPVPTEFDDLLMNKPEAKVVFNDPESYPEWDQLLSLIDCFYRKNYKEYTPNKYGELFK